MADVVFSSWGGKVVDNRQGGEPQAAVFKLPENYLDEGRIGAFMGWDGIILFDREVDVVAMAAEYMKRVQEKYCCAKCTPGKRGTRVMMDTLARILAGQGTEARSRHPDRAGRPARELQVHPVHDRRPAGARQRQVLPRRLSGLPARRAPGQAGQGLSRQADRPVHRPLPGAHRHSGLRRGDQGVPPRRGPRHHPPQHADPGGVRPGLPAPLRKIVPAGPGRRADQHHGAEAGRRRP